VHIYVSSFHYTESNLFYQLVYIYIYIYIYVYMCVCVCMCIYIYIYIYIKVCSDTYFFLALINKFVLLFYEGLLRKVEVLNSPNGWPSCY
jgi:hypothetical protein